MAKPKTQIEKGNCNKQVNDWTHKNHPHYTDGKKKIHRYFQRVKPNLLSNTPLQSAIFR